MDDEFDIYGDGELGSTGLGVDDNDLLANDDDLLYGDLSKSDNKPSEPKIEPDVSDMSRRISNTISDVVDYGDDDLPSAGVDESTEANSKNDAVADAPVKDGSAVPGIQSTKSSATPGVQEARLSTQQPATPQSGAPQNWNVSGIDAGGSRALLVEDLTWWTSDEDIKLALTEAGVADQLVANELSFSEHRVNGKSKGACYIPFSSSEATARSMDFFSQIEIHGRKPTVKILPPNHQGNPFRTVPKDPKEIRADAAKRPPSQHIGGPPTVPAMPAMPVPPMGGMPPIPMPAGVALAAGRGATTVRGRGGFQPGFGRGGYMGGAAPGFFEPEFFPPPHMMGHMPGQFPDQHPYRGGFGRGAGMRGAYAGGGVPGREGFGPTGGFYDRGPYGPDGPYFDGPEYGFDGYGTGGYGRGGGPGGRGTSRPGPPHGSRGPSGSLSHGHGRDQMGDTDRGSPAPRGTSPSVRGETEGDHGAGESKVKREGSVKAEGEQRPSEEDSRRLEERERDLSADHKRPSSASLGSSSFRPRDDRSSHYDERYHPDRYDSRRQGYGREFDRDAIRERERERERDRHHERDSRRGGSGVEVYVKERDIDDRAGHGIREERDHAPRREHSRDVGGRRRDWSRDRSRDRDGRRNGAGATSLDRRGSDASALVDVKSEDRRGRSRSRRRGSRSRSRSRSPGPPVANAGSGDVKAVPLADRSPSPGRAKDAMDVTAPPAGKSREHSPSPSRSGSRTRSTSRHGRRKRKERSRSPGDGAAAGTEDPDAALPQFDENGEPIPASLSKRRKSSRHGKSSSSRRHKSSRSSRRSTGDAAAGKSGSGAEDSHRSSRRDRNERERDRRER
ncbi:hypothetical protein DFJ77DRAFT_447763 [Powellomyces hirtus]|nr:hypothetical protein DFJ77DRAFT_447763 [Powellomyces hirtus]